jgi:cytosine/adenosine deaminase-related metal-dependent hydrolase
MAILLKNATYIDWQTLEFRKTNIQVKPGKVDFYDAAVTPAGVDEVIDCSGKLVTKSFVIGHHHAYSALSRGMNPPRKTPTNFYEILK